MSAFRFSQRLVCGAVIGLALSIAGPMAANADPQSYAWRSEPVGLTLAQGVAPPSGFSRVDVAADSFGAWLRGLPLKPKGSPVLLHNGERKWRQDVHVAVIDIDVGERDLQQCADAVMRLRAEWLWSTGRRSKIGFNYTGGGRVPFSKWARGLRPSSTGKSWRKRGKRDSSYKSFQRYMIQIFAYAGTYSLSREMKTKDAKDIEIGDVFIKGGFPGHAILVADMVVNSAGEKRFLLVQSYMPAQEMHVLKNPNSDWGSPWYDASFSWPLRTPEWEFRKGSLKRWP